jgi:uncharacterized damage-inducible protein DinB
MKDLFSELFEYNRYTNSELIKVILANKEVVSEKSVKWMNHILNAQHIWNSRINKTVIQFKTWDMHEMESLPGLNEENYAISMKIIQGSDFASIVDYTTFSGQSMTNTVQDILFHIINHSTYHRGQVAVDFRATGLEPLVTDYVFWKRGK